VTSNLPERDSRRAWHPYTQHGVDGPPLPVVRAEGSLLELADGRRLIDAISSWWACLHGHGHPRLVEAMERQARELDHVLFAGATHEAAVGLAEELIDVAPEGLSRCFFSDNGSTAVEVALKMVYHRWALRGEPERRRFVTLRGSYHGDTVGAMSVGDPSPFFDVYEPFLFDVERIEPRTEALVEVLESNRGRIAGLLLEPLVQGAAGMRVHSSEFLRDARRLCDEHGLPLVADEVMTGFGRTGRLFACETAGISPDYLCLAKGLTSGMLPLAVTLTTEEVFESFLWHDRSRFFAHGHTMTANPIGCAVARASLSLSLETRVWERLDELGRRIEDRIAPLRDRQNVEHVRRAGGIVAFDLVPKEGDARGYLASVAPRLRAAAIERGVLIRPLGDVVYALPPAATSAEQADRIADVMVELAELG